MIDPKLQTSSGVMMSFFNSSSSVTSLAASLRRVGCLLFLAPDNGFSFNDELIIVELGPVKEDLCTGKNGRQWKKWTWLRLRIELKGHKGDSIEKE